jgi:S1-C subfamily serine protease
MRCLSFAVAFLLCGISVSAQTEPPRLIRSQSGPSGTVVGNRFVFDDVRSRFAFPQDKSLVVYFEWDAPPGEHLLTGIWKAPDGRPVSLSDDIKLQTPTRELHAYWKFELSASMASGVWTLEVRVDGQPAGTHIFEVSVPAPAVSVSPIPAPPSPSVPAPPAPPSLEEVYRKALRSMVWVYKVDDSGRRTDTASGFILSKDHVATAFQIIDAAASIEVELSDGRVVKTSEIWNASRPQDWALIKADTQNLPSLERDQSESGVIGDRLIAINVEGNAARTIGGVDISGRQDHPSFPGRVQISPGLDAAAAGGPLLTTFGRVAGILGGNLVPGARFERRASALNPGLWTAFSPAAAATPIKLVPSTGTSQPTTLQLLRSTGVLSAPLFPNPNFSYGGVTTNVPKDVNAPIANDVREFSRRDASIWIYTWWQRRDKNGKGNVSAKVYDVQNRSRIETTMLKANISDNRPTRFAFSFSPTSLERGTYRVDVLWENQAVWRTFLTIVD